MDKGDEERDREKKEVQQDDANFVFVSFFQFNSIPEHLRAISPPPRGVMRQTLKLAAAAGDEWKATLALEEGKKENQQNEEEQKSNKGKNLQFQERERQRERSNTASVASQAHYAPIHTYTRAHTNHIFLILSRSITLATSAGQRAIRTHTHIFKYSTHVVVGVQIN